MSDATFSKELLDTPMGKLVRTPQRALVENEEFCKAKLDNDFGPVETEHDPNITWAEEYRRAYADYVFKNMHHSRYVVHISGRYVNMITMCNQRLLEQCDFWGNRVSDTTGLIYSGLHYNKQDIVEGLYHPDGHQYRPSWEFL